MAPIIAGSTGKCVAPAGVQKVSFWAFYCGEVDGDGQCTNVYVQKQGWKKGAVMKSNSNFVVLDSSNMGSTGAESGDDIKGRLDKAKASIVKEGGVRDNPHSRYVVMMDDPIAAAKSTEGLPFKYFTYLCGGFYAVVACLACRIAIGFD